MQSSMPIGHYKMLFRGDKVDPHLLDCIDSMIRYVWENEMPKDYEEGWLLKEDTLKNSLYFYIRKHLEPIMEKHDLRIYTEYKIAKEPYRADLVIAKLKPMEQRAESEYLLDTIEEIPILMELKYKAWAPDMESVIRKDVEKIRNYISRNVASHYYLVTIFEAEEDDVFFIDGMRDTWAKGKVTELAAGYINGDLCFRTVRL